MLKIFNTFTGKKEIFKPIIKNFINLYVCGVTVYDFCHIGHGRTFVVFDMIVRYLRHINYTVKYVRNITDIDDKIINKSIKENIDIHFLTKKMIHAMNCDFALLGLLRPNYEPRVTDCIHEIIGFIDQLINNKNAYINNYGDVIFSVNSDINYGMLSRQNLKLLQLGTRTPIDYVKKNPLDFVLWKKSHTNNFSWNSPWGQGRPGWHIECSTMTSMHFKNSLDIHGGGSDLLFPHHENERAQSISVNKEFKVNFWMHAGMVIVKNKKMSKSLGNTYLLKDFLSDYDPETIRYFFLSTHYRRPIYYNNKNLIQARLSLESLYLSLLNTKPIFNFSVGKSFENEFYTAMNNDFNTPKAFMVLFKIAHKINILKKYNVFKANLLAFRLCTLAGSLGLLLQKPKNFLQKYSYNQLDCHKIEILIQKRNIFRQKKLWIQADNIRKKLMSLGIIIEDLSTKTVWRKK